MNIARGKASSMLRVPSSPVLSVAMTWNQLLTSACLVRSFVFLINDKIFILCKFFVCLYYSNSG